MKVLQKTTMLAVLTILLAAGSVFSQTDPAQQAPAQQPPTQQPPAKPPATQPPAQPPAGQQPAPQPPRPFPEGAKVAYVYLQAIASNSAEGKAATAKIQEMEKKKMAELGDKNKQLEALKTKLQQQASVINDQARTQIEKDIDKMNREIQFFQQEAQAERDQLQNELQMDFQRKLNPILEQVAKEKGLHVLLDGQSSGAVWADPGLDLTSEVIKRFDAVSKTPAVKK
jgi:outer membrane protein